MIHEIGVELTAFLREQGCPFPVVDGPERDRTNTFARERIVLEYADDGSDSFAPKHMARGNPKSLFTRVIACKATIYASSPAAGPREFEHRRRADRVLDQVLVGLYEVIVGRKNVVAFQGGRYLEPEDLKPSERPGGAVYELKFTFDRGIAKTTWKGDGLPEATIGTTVEIDNTTKVSAAGDPANPSTATVPTDAETV